MVVGRWYAAVVVEMEAQRVCQDRRVETVNTMRGEGVARGAGLWYQCDASSGASSGATFDEATNSAVRDFPYVDRINSKIQPIQPQQLKPRQKQRRNTAHTHLPKKKGIRRTRTRKKHGTQVPAQNSASGGLALRKTIEIRTNNLASPAHPSHL